MNLWNPCSSCLFVLLQNEIPPPRNMARLRRTERSDGNLIDGTGTAHSRAYPFSTRCRLLSQAHTSRAFGCLAHMHSMSPSLPAALNSRAGAFPHTHLLLRVECSRCHSITLLSISARRSPERAALALAHTLYRTHCRFLPRTHTNRAFVYLTCLNSMSPSLHAESNSRAAACLTHTYY